ncbi:MAG TPA: UvrB/UvrC motif-containing protein, partial [bacterium]|nr:UvrB/UvrC motif-containing protein [bacterium]
DKQCSSCGRSWKKFEESGKLGCAACYETFRKELKTLIRRLHGAAQHKGKEPVTSARELNGEGKMRKLEQELKEAVEKEQYERAAVIRDQIRDLRKNNP